MTRTEQENITHIAPTDISWHKMYLLGGIMALLVLVGTLIDISLTMMPGWEVTTIPTTIQSWFTQLEVNPMLGLRNLDLLNVIISLLQIPMFLALYGVHRKLNQSFAMLALVVWLIGTVLFISSNTALSMLELSRQYSSLVTESQQAKIEAAGVAHLARGAHGSMGAFMGFFLSSIGTLIIGFVMLQGKVFSRVAAWVGIVGIALLMIYTIGNTFISNAGEIMLIIAMPGGILMIAWYIMVAIKLFKLGSGREE